MNDEQRSALWAQLTEGGSDPSVFYMHPQARDLFLLIMERRKHWYWRLWYWLRWTPSDLRFHLRVWWHNR